MPRINSIYNELLTLSTEQFPNACSVTLRVFIELSVDHFLEDKKLMTANQMRNLPLAKRLKAVAAELESKGLVSTKLKIAVEKIADGKSALAPRFRRSTSTSTTNSCFHVRPTCTARGINLSMY